MSEPKKMVTLENEYLGQREFEASHAARIIAQQKRLKKDHWKPVKTTQPPAEKKNEANGDANTATI